jgi:hypothetical protein
MTYRFRIAGEYFDAKSEGNMIAGGTFQTLAMAKRAMKAVRAFIKQPDEGKLPADLEEVVAAADPATLEIALYARASNGPEMWVMSFDEDGKPTDLTDDVDLLWALIGTTVG